MLLYDRLGAKVAQGYLSGTCGVCWIERVPGSQGGTRKHCVCVCVCVWSGWDYKLQQLVMLQIYNKGIQYNN